MLRTTTLAAVLVAGIGTPAWAAWDRIGSVDITSTRERASAYSNFGGPVEQLRLDADRGDVMCSAVRVTFANGRSRNVFTGRLRNEQSRTVDLPGDQRTIRRIDFSCRTLETRRARINIAAEIGRYRETWRRNPNFMRLWGNAFDWARDDRRAGGGRDADWVRLGSENFSARRETETTFTGFAGRNISTIALQPVDDDARCTQVRVTFANGASQIVRPQVLPEDRMTRLDLAGGTRNVTRLAMTCRAVGDRDVTINIYGT